jgi:polyhydroxyalkanoate synthesis regulator phasin
LEGPPVTEGVSTETARAILNDLIRQRKRMQGTDAERNLLEANRLAIVFWQQELRRAIKAQQNDERAAS